ncbi:MAG: redoxin family protein [Firmicutes bacterium]|nr:redoxin family protein [Bacillota bacterium]
MKHRIIALWLAACLLFALTACGGPAQEGTAADPADEPSVPAKSEYDFPDVRFFEATLLDGSTVSAEELFDGRDVTVINCWATWCPPCLEEMDELAAFAKTLPDNVQLVSFCVDGAQHTDDCASILEDAGFEGKTIVSASGDLATLIEQMQYVPTTIFVDSIGRQTGDSLIGAPADLASAYTARINAALKMSGKDTL